MGTLVFQANLGGAVNLIGPNTASTVNFTLPSADGTSGQALVTNGSGTLSFSTFTSGAAGSNTQVQFNSSGAFAGSANLTFNGTTLTAANTSVTTSETLSYGTANGVAYLNGSKVVTTGSALTFDGTNTRLGVGVASPGYTIDSGGIINTASAVYWGGGVGKLQYSGTDAYIDSTGSTVFRISGSTEQMRLTSTGLGIGTSSPTAKLTVSSGEARLDLTATNASGRNWNLYSGGGGNVGAGAFAIAEAGATQRFVIVGGGTGESMRIDASGNVGIGTSSPAYKLDVQGTGTQTLRVQTNTSGNPTLNLSAAGADSVSLLFDRSGNALRFDISSITGAMYLNTAGNLGLGVTPSAWISSGKAIDIAGFGSVAQTSSGSLASTFNAYQNSAGNWIYKTTNAAAQYQCGLSGLGQHAWFTAASGTAGNAITFTQAMTLDASGNLGIGTTSPGTKLDVRGVIQGGDGTIKPVISYTGGAGEGVFGTLSNHPVAFYTNSTERARITSGGEVYIAGTTDQGAYNLQVNGTGVWGAGAYVNGSDARLKEEVQDLAPALDVIASLRPVTFRYKEDYSKDQNVQPGFIAQELQTAMAGQAYVDGVIQSGPQHLNVAYQSLIPLLTKAIQELKAEFDAYKATHP